MPCAITCPHAVLHHVLHHVPHHGGHTTGHTAAQWDHTGGGEGGEAVPSLMCPKIVHKEGTEGTEGAAPQRRSDGAVARLPAIPPPPQAKEDCYWSHGHSDESDHDHDHGGDSHDAKVDAHAGRFRRLSDHGSDHGGHANSAEIDYDLTSVRCLAKEMEKGCGEVQDSQGTSLAQAMVMQVGAPLPGPTPSRQAAAWPNLSPPVRAASLQTEMIITILPAIIALDGKRLDMAQSIRMMHVFETLVHIGWLIFILVLPPLVRRWGWAGTCRSSSLPAARVLPPVCARAGAASSLH